MQWNSEEIQLLDTFKKSKFRHQWKKISIQFSRKGFQKTELQCKRKWMQLYNEDFDSSQWTFNELQTLYSLYNTHNSQWSIIHKSIPSKNKVKIRNRFYGTLRNFVRFLLQHFQQASGAITVVSNKIKPVILQKLYSSQEQFQFVGETLRNLIFYMNYSIDKQKLAEEVNKDQQFYQKILNTILKKKSKLRDKQKQQIAKENSKIINSLKINTNISYEQRRLNYQQKNFNSVSGQTRMEKKQRETLTQESSTIFHAQLLPKIVCPPQIIIWPSQQHFRWQYPVYFNFDR